MLTGLHPLSRRTVVALSTALAVSAFAASAARAATVGNFSYGQLQASTVGASGCGTNAAGEPAIHVSRANNVFLGSGDGPGGGSQIWPGVGAAGRGRAAAGGRRR